MRADRLLSILLTLQVNRRVTARELAERLEVSERTIYRDMEALSGAGIPVMAERGSNGGWSLMDEYRTDLTGLNEAEINALFLAKPPRLLRDLGLDHASEAALIKLLAALPTMQRDNLDFLRQRIHIDAMGWKSHKFQEAVPHLQTLQDALWQERKAAITYRRSDGEDVERIVDPFGLVAKGTIWYLVAAVENDDGGTDIRTYRVSRVLEVRILNTSSQRPRDFDLPAFWSQSTAELATKLPRYPAILRAEASLVPVMRTWRWSTVEQVDPPDEGGWVRVHVLFEVIEEATESILSCGARIEVLEPDELRQRVIESAQAILRLYETRPLTEPA